MTFPSLLLVPFVTLSQKVMAYEVGKKKSDEAWLPSVGRNCCPCQSGYILGLSLSELLLLQTSSWWLLLTEFHCMASSNRILGTPGSTLFWFLLSASETPIPHDIL